VTDQNTPQPEDVSPSTAEEPTLEMSQDSVESPSHDAEDLTGDLAEARDLALRAQADLENYRRRVQREQEQERRYATMPLLRDLVPVLDNIHRALVAAQDQPSNGLLEGFQMVAQQLESALAQHGCTVIAADGVPFDPNLHEAVSQMPSDDFEQGTVMIETAAGYQLHDRVVRPSQVIVSTGPAE